MLVEGEWKTEERIPRDPEGRFVRSPTAFRDWVTADGSSGFAAQGGGYRPHTRRARPRAAAAAVPPARWGGFEAQAGRYHLYIAWACPWAHRAALLRKLKGLEEAISLSAVGSFMGDDGWAFYDEPGVVSDTVNEAYYLREIYQKADPTYTGRVKHPGLRDQEPGTAA